MDIFELFKKIKTSPPSMGKPPQFLIAGLGNPGAKYENTRHNAGFLALDYLAQKTGASVKKLKFKALCGEGALSGVPVLFLKPQTFMNLSGESIREAADFYKIPMEQVLVLYDDVSLPAGRLRIRRKGSAGGHNGMKSILYQMGTDEFPRIKIGVGQKPEMFSDLADWVLSSFSKEERIALENALPDVYEAAGLIVSGGVDESMNRFNG